MTLLLKHQNIFQFLLIVSNEHYITHQYVIINILL